MVAASFTRFTSSFDSAAYADPATFNLAGVWKTVDGGAHWSGVVGPDGSNTPCDYDPPGPRAICDNVLTLAVDPTDPTAFYVGGVRLFRYTSSGATATLVGYGNCGGCIHVDQRASVFDAANRLWIGNDGGVYRTDDAGASFLNRNGSGTGSLAITEFEPWTSGSIAGGTFVGGTQDVAMWGTAVSFAFLCLGVASAILWVRSR